MPIEFFLILVGFFCGLTLGFLIGADYILRKFERRVNEFEYKYQLWAAELERSYRSFR